MWFGSVLDAEYVHRPARMHSRLVTCNFKRTVLNAHCGHVDGALVGMRHRFTSSRVASRGAVSDVVAPVIPGACTHGGIWPVPPLRLAPVEGREAVDGLPRAVEPASALPCTSRPGSSRSPH